MNITQKTNLFLAIFILVGLALIFSSVYPLIRNIQREARELIAQRNAAAELAVKIQNLGKFQETYGDYRPNLEKIGTLFVNASEPINFIEFLEEEARSSSLAIDIVPLSVNAVKSDFWPSMNFQLTLNGSFANFLEFFEKLESSDFLVETVNLDVSNSPSETETTASLLVKVYTK